MKELFKEITLKEYARAGIGALILMLATYLLYMDNKRHQLLLESRVERLEMEIKECNLDKFRLLNDQINKNNDCLNRVEFQLRGLR